MNMMLLFDYTFGFVSDYIWAYHHFCQDFVRNYPVAGTYAFEQVQIENKGKI